MKTDRKVRSLGVSNFGVAELQELRGKQTDTVDFRSFVVFFWAETLAH